MEKLPLINKITGKAEWVLLKDILYGHVQDEKISFYTSNGIYRPITTIRDFLPLLQPLGFEQLEKSNIVNLVKVIGYDDTSHTALFDKSIFSCRIKVSRRNRGKIRGLIE